MSPTDRGFRDIGGSRLTVLYEVRGSFGTVHLRAEDIYPYAFMTCYSTYARNVHTTYQLIFLEILCVTTAVGLKSRVVCQKVCDRVTEVDQTKQSFSESQSHPANSTIDATGEGSNGDSGVGC